MLFRIEKTFSAETEEGWINRTFRADLAQAGRVDSWVFQKTNGAVTSSQAAKYLGYSSFIAAKSIGVRKGKTDKHRTLASFLVTCEEKKVVLL